MSSIDKRIVEMEFDNKQFERGVKTTSKTLSRFKKKLNMSESSKSLKQLNATGKEVDLSGIAKGVDTISNRFTTLGIVGVTALRNITNSALRAGKNIVSALTIDPVRMGLEEYETKMNAIKTILANTSVNGTTLNDVNAALKELNDYSDNTIYNFAQMTDMVGKFAATSGELDSSVAMVKGLSNLAAEAGVQNQQLQSSLYQVSQAMSGADFRLMDWRSLENAGMATKGFRNDLIETAKAMGAFKGQPEVLRQLKEETVSFGRTLESGWLSTDVFASVAETYAMSEAMTKAAGDVTTVTKLMTVMKESVQSGWTESWEAIIGDKEQSTTLLNSIRDAFDMMVGPSMKARNEMLKFWNANGGREDIIMSLVNSFLALRDILSPIKEGFRNIFPKKTGEELVELSARIREFTDRFTSTDETSENLKQTFEGLFSILKMGVTTFKGLVELTTGLVGAFGGLNLGVLNATGHIGNYLTNLSMAYEESELFQNILKTLTPFVSTLGEGFRELVDNIKDFSTSAKSLSIFKGLSIGIKVASNALSGLVSIFGDFADSTGLSKLGTVQKQVSDTSESLDAGVSHLSSSVVNLKDILNDLANGVNYDRLGKTLKDGILGGGLLVIMKKVMDLLDSGASFTKGIKDILDGVAGSLEAYQQNLKANALLKVGGAIGLLAISLLTLASIDPKALKAGTMAITGLFVNLFGGMKAFGGATGPKAAASLTILSASMVTISAAVLILSNALKKVSDINSESLQQSMLTIMAITGTLVTAAKVLSSSGPKIMSASAGLILFSIAVRSIASSVEKLGKLDTDSIVRGLGGVTGIIAALTAFSHSMGSASVGLKTSVALIAIAKSVQMLSDATAGLAQLNLKELGTGLLGVSGILAAIVAFSKGVSGSSMLISTGVGMIFISKALTIMSDAIKSIGGLDVETIGKGLLGIAGSLGIMAVAMRAMPTTTPVIAAGLVMSSVAISKIGKAISQMGSNDLETIGKGLMTLAGGLAILATAAYAMSGTLTGSAAMLVMSVSLSSLSKSLMRMGEMSLSEIGKSLLMLGGAFAVIGVAGMALAPLVPVLLGLSGAMTLMGAGLFVAGAGLSLVSLGLQGLVSVVKTAGASIPAIIGALGTSFIVFLQVLGDNADEMAASVKKIFISFMKMLAELIPESVQIIGDLIIALLQKVVELLPQIVDAGISIVLALLEGISSRAGEIADTAFTVIISFIEALDEAIEDNGPTLADSILNLFLTILSTTLKVLINSVTKFVDVGIKIIKGLGRGIKKTFEFVTDAISTLLTNVKEKITDSIASFIEIGEQLIAGLIKGVKNKAGEAKDAVANVGKSLLDGAKDKLGIASPSKEFELIGGYITSGLVKGINDGKSNVEDSSEAMLDGAKEASKDTSKEIRGIFEDLFDPKETKEAEEEAEDAGERAGESLAEGLDNTEPAVSKAAGNLGEKASKSFLEKQKEMIDERKFYNNMSLMEELEAWEEVQAHYEEGTEERKRADRKAYSLKEEITGKMKKLDDDKYKHTKQINARLRADLKQLDADYEASVDKRANAIYDSFSMFEEVYSKYDKIWDTNGMVDNFERQIEVLKEWKENLAKLRDTGVPEAMMDELEEMGPSSAREIEALVRMSDFKLDEYVELWETKHKIAREQSILEHTKMREGLSAERSKLFDEASSQLNLINSEYNRQVKEIKGNSIRDITAMRQQWDEQINQLRNNTESDFRGMKNTIQNMGWPQVGKNIVEGMRSGVKTATGRLVAQVRAAMKEAMEAARDELGINSPSKEFMKVGSYAMEGFVVGVDNHISNIVSSTKNAGKSATDALRKAFSSAQDIVERTDATPTIKPIMDLSNVKKGISDVSRMFGSTGLSTSINKANSVRTDTANNTKGTVVNEYNFEQHNNSPKALSRTEIYRQTRNQLKAVTI